MRPTFLESGCHFRVLVLALTNQDPSLAAKPEFHSHSPPHGDSAVIILRHLLHYPPQFPEQQLENLLEDHLASAPESLAVIGADWREQPVGFAAAASAAVADGAGAIGLIAESSGSTGGELAGLEDDAGLGEVEGLVFGTALFQSELERLLQLGLRDWVRDWFIVSLKVEAEVREAGNWPTPIG